MGPAPPALAPATDSVVAVVPPHLLPVSVTFLSEAAPVSCAVSKALYIAGQSTLSKDLMEDDTISEDSDDE